MTKWGPVQEYAAGQPDAGTPRVDSSQGILTIPFTADLERHRANIAKLYDAPVCVELTQHTDRELRALFGRAQADVQARGLQMILGHGGGSADQFVAITVVAVTPKESAEIEAAYDGLLQLSSFLQPVNRD